MAAGAEPEYEGAWAAEPIEDEIELPEMLLSVANEADRSQVDAHGKSDWFYEVDEGGDESNGEMGYSGGGVVDVFSTDMAPGGAIASTEIEGTTFKDLEIKGQSCNDYNELEGADSLSGASTARLQVEYGGGTTSESSGKMPDLDLFENPQIEFTAMEWRTTKIDEVKTRSRINHRGGEDYPVTERARDDVPKRVGN